MIKLVSGDILLSKAAAIVQGVAPNDHFNQGLALALREQFPAMYKDFRHYCHSHHPKTGSLWSWAGANGKRIINLFTQAAPIDDKAHPGKASFENLHHCLRELKKEVVKEKIASIALPKLATGVGGLNWNEVKAMIEKDLADMGVPVYLYSDFKPGQQALE